MQALRGAGVSSLRFDDGQVPMQTAARRSRTVNDEDRESIYSRLNLATSLSQASIARL